MGEPTMNVWIVIAKLDFTQEDPNPSENEVAVFTNQQKAVEHLRKCKKEAEENWHWPEYCIIGPCPLQD